MASDGTAARRLLANELLEHFSEDAARVLESESAEQTAALLANQPRQRVLAVVQKLTPDRAARVIAALDDDSTRRVLTSLDPNRASSLLSRLAPEEREACLSPLPVALRSELQALSEYPADSAAGLMDTRITTFRSDATVREVVRRLRTFRRRAMRDIFVVDVDDHLLGSVSLQDVVLAPSTAHLEAIMRSPTPYVQATASRDEVISEFQTHRLGSLPVVDFDGRVLGVLHESQLIEAAQERASTSAVTMVGAGKDERALSPPIFAVRKRLPWLQINLVTAFLAAAVVGLFENTIATYTALAVLLPVVAGQSGNTGAQALAVTMRALALREVRTSQWLRVVTKELVASALNGVAVALTTSIAVYLWSRSTGLALVIAVSMVLSMTAAGLAGAAIPMILTSLRQDPAQSSSIILTTVTDVVGFFSFLGIATALSSML